MRRSLACLTLAIGLSVGATPCAYADKAPVMTVEELDRIVSQAANLQEFLASKKIQDEYFDALAAYYGPERFPRTSYDHILAQLRMLQETFPHIAQLLWNVPKGIQSFRIRIRLRTSGLRLRSNSYGAWLAAWKTQLAGAAEPAAESLLPFAREIAAAIAEHHRSVESLPRGKKAEATGAFIAQIKARPEFQRVLSLALLERLNGEHTNDMLQAGDADLVLLTLEQLRRSSDFTLGGQTLPKELQNFVASRVPSLETPKLQVVDGKPLQTELFVVDTIRSRRGKLIPLGTSSETEFEFRGLLRLIHAVWKGIPLNECVAGSDQYLSSITPERWATALLENSLFYQIERIHEEVRSYQGFVQLIPGILAGGTYASVDFGSPLFGKKIIGDDGQVGIFFDLWLKEARKHFPPHWEGAVVSESNSVDNAGVLNRIRRRPAYFLGKMFPASERFAVRDDVAKFLASLGIREGQAGNYAGRMIFDAVVPKAKRLTVLDPEAAPMPPHVSLTEAADLLRGASGTVKAPILAAELVPRIAAIDSANRALLFSLLNDEEISRDFTLGLYRSPLIEKLTEEEAAVLVAMGDSGKEIVAAKASHLRAAIFVQVARLMSFSAPKVEALAAAITAVPRHMEALKAALADGKIAMAAARLLQHLGHENTETDAVVVATLQAKETPSNTSTLIAEYLTNAKSPSAVFTESVIEHGFSHHSRTVNDAASNFVRRQGALVPALRAKLLAKVERVDGLRQQFRIANVFPADDLPPRIQQIYLWCVGKEDFEQKSLVENIRAWPKIDAAAIQSVANWFEELGSDEVWALTHLLAHATNFAHEDLRAAMLPKLDSKNGRAQLAAARVLAAHGVVTDFIERILIGGGEKSATRTASATTEKTQLSAEFQERLVTMLEENDNSELAFGLLVKQKVLPSALVDRLRTAQAGQAVATRYYAARILLARGLTDQNTATAMTAALGDRYWDQPALLERLRRVFGQFALTDRAYVVCLSRVWRNLPVASPLLPLLPPRTVRIEGVDSVALDRYLQFLHGTARQPAADEVPAFATLVANEKFPVPEALYWILREEKTPTGAAAALARGLKSSSSATRFYSALLLHRREGQWSEDIQRELAPYYTFDDVPSDQKWSGSALDSLVPLLAKVTNRYEAAASKLAKILRAAVLSGVHRDQLGVIASQKGDGGDLAKEILRANPGELLGARGGKSALDLRDPAQAVEAIAGGEAEDAKDALVKLPALPAHLIPRLVQLSEAPDRDRRICAAVVLEHHGVWNGSVEAAFVEVQDGSGHRWNKDYFAKKRANHPMSDAVFYAQIANFSDPEVQFNASALLYGMPLTASMLARLRADQDSADFHVRVMSAAVLASAGLGDDRTKAVLAKDAVAHLNLSTGWLTKRLEALGLDAAAVETLRTHIVGDDPKLSQRAAEVFFSSDSPSAAQLDAWDQFVLDSSNPRLRLETALKLFPHRPSEAVEAALVDGLLDEGWNHSVFFTRLEKNVRLTAATQLRLAEARLKEDKEKETLVTRLLRNQIELAPDATAVLAKASDDAFVREILAGKSTAACGPLMQGQSDSTSTK